MLSTYKAILKNDYIKWCDVIPNQLERGEEVIVHVTILDESPVSESSDVSRGGRMALVLEQLAAMREMAELGDPLAWEREVRRDRVLPDRLDLEVSN